jgi:hypothetical protein
MVRWTPAHLDLIGNNKADELAKNACNKSPCQWATSTFGWLRLQPHAHMMRQWNTLSPHSPCTAFPTAQQALTRRQLSTLAKVRTGTTSHDFHPITHNPTCPCGQNDSNNQQILGCPLYRHPRKSFFGNEPPSMDLLYQTNLNISQFLLFTFDLDLM